MPPRPVADPVAIPVSVLTGFLGAGKTTLLNRLLKDPGLADTAVIINEFGAVAIDHLLVEQSSDGVIQLADGCLCCSVRGALVDTLADLVDRLQTGRIVRLKRVVIETTGLADPAPVLQALMAHPVLAQAFRLDGVIAVVDAVNGEATLDAHAEAIRQVAMADRLVLAKTDLAGVAATGPLRARLRALNPGAEIVEAGAEQAGQAALLACGLYDPSTKTVDVRRWLGEALHADHHDDHSGHAIGAVDQAGHAHAGHLHDGRISTVSLVEPRPLPFGAVETFIDLLQTTHGERLLRLKGIVELAEDPSRPLVLHGVQRLFHPPARLPFWPDAGRGTRLVLIMLDTSQDAIRRLFAAATSRPAIDTPDRAALEDNPLAIAGMGGAGRQGSTYR